jgi:hypothetical protein
LGDTVHDELKVVRKLGYRTRPNVSRASWKIVWAVAHAMNGTRVKAERITMVLVKGVHWTSGSLESSRGGPHTEGGLIYELQTRGDLGIGREGHVPTVPAATSENRK